jgi:hypothetical protein
MSRSPTRKRPCRISHLLCSAAHRHTPADHHRVPESVAHRPLPPSDSSVSPGQ